MYSEWDSQGKINKQTNKQPKPTPNPKTHLVHFVLHTRYETPSSSQQNVIAKFNSNSFNFTVVTSLITIKKAVTQFLSNLQIKLL